MSDSPSAAARASPRTGAPAPEADLAAALQAVTSERDALRLELERAHAQVEDALSSATNSAAEVADAYAQMGQLQSDITARQAIRAKLESQVQALITAQDELESEKALLARQVAALEAQLKQISATGAAATSPGATRAPKPTHLPGPSVDQQAMAAALEDMAGQLSVVVAELEATQAEVDSREEECQRLRAQVRATGQRSMAWPPGLPLDSTTGLLAVTLGATGSA
jgi:chromosome segregation ATPase